MSPKKRTTLPIDVYVRVSQTAGREGDSFQSPAEQEDRCRAQLAADGLAVGEVFTDLDVSGGKMERPGLDTVMERIRSGLSGGIAVAYLSRLGRTTVGVIQTIDEIEAHGGVVIAVAEKLDTATPTGRFVVTLFAALAQMELERYSAQWDSATERFLARGGHGGPITPAGFDRNGNGSLRPNADAPHIAEAFRMRGRGATVTEIARHLTEREVTFRTFGDRDPVTGKCPVIERTDWGGSAVRAVLRNDVYLGIASVAKKQREGAHQAIVTRAEFNAAQSVTRAAHRGDSRGSLLAGLIVCATCGTPLTNDGDRYRCNPRGRDARCEHKALIRKSAVEPLVVGQVLDAWQGWFLKPSTAEDRSGDLEAAVRAAEEELAAFMAAVPATTPGFGDAVAQRTDAVESARQALAEYTPVAAAPSRTVVRQLRDVAAVDDDAAHEQLRQLIARTIQRIEVAPGRAPAGRVTVTWREQFNEYNDSAVTPAQVVAVAGRRQS